VLDAPETGELGQGHNMFHVHHVLVGTFDSSGNIPRRLGALCALGFGVGHSVARLRLAE